MRRTPIYTLFCLLVLGGISFAELTGWALSTAGRGKAVPRSVRENPGAYRTVYRGPYRYLHGK